jgi:hypothetical protein
MCWLEVIAHASGLLWVDLLSAQSCSGDPLELHRADVANARVAASGVYQPLMQLKTAIFLKSPRDSWLAVLI